VATEGSQALAVQSSGSDALTNLEREISESAAPVQYEALPAALEPELRKIIDTAVARVAAIELDAIRQSRALTQRSEQQGREALKYALDRAFQLMNSFELLTATIAGMVDALRTELDDAVTALRDVQEPESALSRELDARKEEKPEPEPEPEPVAVEPEPEPEPVVSEPEPQPEPAVPEPVAAVAAEPALNGVEAHTEPSPEMEETFRERLRTMKDDGKSRQEAERSLLRFNLGRLYVPLLDEIYPEDEPAAMSQPSSNGQRKRRVRSFFTR